MKKKLHDLDGELKKITTAVQHAATRADLQDAQVRLSTAVVRCEQRTEAVRGEAVQAMETRVGEIQTTAKQRLAVTKSINDVEAKIVEAEQRLGRRMDRIDEHLREHQSETGRRLHATEEHVKAELVAIAAEGTYLTPI